MGSCARTTWRGVIVCAHSVPKYNAWAESVGKGIMLTPLAGCGSYQTTTVASAGTHAGGGAIDIDLRNVGPEWRKPVADLGRTAGLQVSWHRNYVSGLWTWHCHALDPSCPNLAPAAAAQVVEFGNGGDGLVGSTPDANTRTNVPQIMALFATRFVTNVAQSVTNDAKIKGIQAAVKTTVDGIFGDATYVRVERVRAMSMYGKANFDRQGLQWRKDGQTFIGAYADGVWGTQTANMVKSVTIQIQKALGCYADGVWGPATDSVYQALRAACYKPAPKPAPSPIINGIDTSVIKVGLTAPIPKSKLKIGAPKSGEVARYQAALWNACAPSTRADWAKKWGLSRTAVYDGVYGKATADLTRIMYNWLSRSEPNGGWTPTATEPGAGLLKHIGFTNVV